MKGHGSGAAAVALPCAVLVLAGCAALRELMRDPPLVGNPSLTGLLVVDCEIITDFTEHSVLDILLEHHDHANLTGGALSDESGILLEGRVEDNLLIFENLLPDRYHLMEIRAVRNVRGSAKELYDCPSDQIKECPSEIKLEYPLHTDGQVQMTFEIPAGGLVYGGRLVIDEDHDPPFRPNWELSDGSADYHKRPGRGHVMVLREPALERKAWEALIENRERTARTELIEARIATLPVEEASS